MENKGHREDADAEHNTKVFLCQPSAPQQHTEAASGCLIFRVILAQAASL
jgi:hypothetical protein